MLPFYKPHYDPALAEEVREVLESGWITTGPKTKLFEKNITEYCGNGATLAVNAATNGLELMLRWFGVEEGDEVILPAYTYCATANVIVHCGATPVFVDVGDDFNISIEAIENAITPQTKVIMPVDFAGFPCNYNEINELVSRTDVKGTFNPQSTEQEKLARIMVLSDSAHAFGATCKGKKTGSLTDVSVFSFHAVKNLSTGEGGAICLNLPDPFDNNEIYKTLNIWSLHGQTKDALSKTQKGEWRYDVIIPGYKCNMTDIQAALGLVELAKYDEETLVRRRQIFDFYSAALSKYEWAQLPLYDKDEKQSSFHVYPLRIKSVSEDQRDQIISGIFGRDISVNVHFVPVPMLSAYKNRGYDISNYPVTYDNYSREITLPVYYDLTDDQLADVVKAVVQSIEEII